MKKSYRRKVQKIIDGDTFKIRNRVNGSQYVRLANVNSPERGQRGYQSARNSLARKIQDKTVTIKPKGRSYGRVVADVIYKRRHLGGFR